MHGVNCNFSQYYTQQAGRGLPIYKGAISQRGYGLWSNLFSRFGVPLLKFIGKQGLGFASKFGDDVINNKINVKEAFRKNIIATGKSVAQQGLSKAEEKLSQLGKGRGKYSRVTKPKAKATKKPAPKKALKRGKSKKTKAPIKRKSVNNALANQIFGY